MRVNYVLATGLALESAIVHSFLWHLKLANLLLMRVLVSLAGLSMRPGSLVSIAFCAGLACDHWGFGWQ
jgi:hypothetical protein